MSYHSDDNGNKSWMRLILSGLFFAFLAWNTIMLCVHLFIARQPLSELFSGGYLNWNGEMLGFLLGGKSVQKGIEVVKDIMTTNSQNNAQTPSNPNGTSTP